MEAGQVYTFTLKAVNDGGKTSTTSINVMWSPAMRFETSEVRLYSASSTTYGSGLSLYDPGTSMPKMLKVADKARWHIAIDDRTSNALWFGSASEIDLGTGTPTDVVEFSDDYWETNDLNTIFEKMPLSSMTFTAKKLNLLALTSTKGIALVARVKRAGQSNWNYAKVLVERGTGGFLQGAGDDKYISMKISYQSVANVPYAK